MNHKLVSYPAVITKAAGETTVHFPDLPDADVTDKNYYQALMRAQIGLAIIIIDLESHHEPVPKPSNPVEVNAQLTNPDAKVEMITTDLDEPSLNRKQIASTFDSS